MYYLGNSDQREVRVKQRCIFPRYIQSSFRDLIHMVDFHCWVIFCCMGKLNVLGCSAHRLLGCFWECLIMLDSYLCLFCPLMWPGNMEPQLKNYLHQICLWDDCGAAFSRGSIVTGESHLLWNIILLTGQGFITFVYDTNYFFNCGKGSYICLCWIW